MAHVAHGRSRRGASEPGMGGTILPALAAVAAAILIAISATGCTITTEAPTPGAEATATPGVENPNAVQAIPQAGRAARTANEANKAASQVQKQAESLGGE